MINARIWFNARVRSRLALLRARRSTRIASTLPSRVFGCAERVTRERGPCRADRVVRVGLARPASPLTVRSVDLNHRDPQAPGDDE